MVILVVCFKLWILCLWKRPVREDKMEWMWNEKLDLSYGSDQGWWMMVMNFTNNPLLGFD